jgi:hypothetical protein
MILELLDFVVSFDNFVTNLSTLAAVSLFCGIAFASLLFYCWWLACSKSYQLAMPLYRNKSDDMKVQKKKKKSKNKVEVDRFILSPVNSAKSYDNRRFDDLVIRRKSMKATKMKIKKPQKLYSICKILYSYWHRCKMLKSPNFCHS